MGTAISRHVELHDFRSLAEFLQLSGGKKADYWLDRFQHWWVKNPAYSEELTRGWLLEDENKICGFIGSIPSFVQIDGVETVVFSATSWNVLPEYRTQSLELWFRLAAASSKTFLFDTTPSDDVLVILKNFMFREIPYGNMQQSLLPVLMRPLLWQKLKGRPLASFIVSLVSPIAQLACDWRFRLNTSASTLEARPIFEFDASVDDLWTRTSGRYFATNVRSREVLNWYCFGNESYKKDVFACYDGEQCVGYIICRERSRQDLRILEYLDVWVDPAYPLVLEKLMSVSRSDAKKRSCAVIQIPHYSEELGARLSVLGLLKRLPGESRSYFKAPKKLMEKAIESNSYFCRVQGDNGL